jgi:hypothetical protein
MSSEKILHLNDYRGPWVSGLAICYVCCHKWTAVCLLGHTVMLECPECKHLTGGLVQGL